MVTEYGIWRHQYDLETKEHVQKHFLVCDKPIESIQIVEDGHGLLGITPDNFTSTSILAINTEGRQWVFCTVRDVIEVIHEVDSHQLSHWQIMAAECEFQAILWNNQTEKEDCQCFSVA